MSGSPPSSTPTNIDATCAQLAARLRTARRHRARRTSPPAPSPTATRELANTAAALDAGADAVTVAGWMAEVTSRTQAAPSVALRTADPGRRTHRQPDHEPSIEGLGDIVAVLADADPRTTAELYEASSGSASPGTRRTRRSW